MNTTISSLVLPLVILLLVVNFILRFSIVKQYNKLRMRKIGLESSFVFNSAKAKAYLSKHHPNDAEEVLKFLRSVKYLVIVAVSGFILILFLFLLSKTMNPSI